jgi:hypothetical protein
MTTNDNENLAKTSNNFYCKCCDYSTSRKYNYDLHVKTDKHKNNEITTENNDFLVKTSTKAYTCDVCEKYFNDRAGLWRHKKKCNIECINNTSSDIVNKSTEIVELKEIMKYLMKENSEMKNMMLKVIENGTHNNNSVITTNTNSHNKAFNLNFFLNETCKEAMNIGEFVDSLKLQLSDLENVGEAGYIEGISNIIVKNLKELDITKRPVHCTDKKRETVYIKDNNIWEKDEDKTQMHKLIKKVVSKNVKMFAKYREMHPDCTTYHSKYSDQYNKIIYESMGGKGDNDFEKNEKIIKNVLKEVVVDKNI